MVAKVKGKGTLLIRGREKALLSEISQMIDEKLGPLKSLEGLKEAMLTPEEDKVQRLWDKYYKNLEKRKNQL